MSTTPTSFLPEVGWQFVPQYYTYVNKHPNRLHCFYTKTSTFTHGMEGEDVKPCFGQQEIHNKITSIGFQDCKVYIHSVDAQSSANGGIIIQVIGEMSNHGDAWKKFVQTFFLAEQPNGYFVLNDIFRFLKEETTEDDMSEADAATLVDQPSSPEQPAAEPAPVPAPAPEPEPVPAPAPAAEPVPSSPSPPSPSTPLPEEEVTTVNPHPPTPPPAIPPEPTPVPESPPQAPTHLSDPTCPTCPTTPALMHRFPPSPKTWASLAAADSKRWALYQPHTPLLPTGHRGQHHGPREYPAVIAAQALTTPQCFVKGVIEPVTQNHLIQTLNQRFGPVKDVEVVRQKACAFLEFVSLDAAKKAIIASLPAGQGGEGGIRIDVGGDVGPVRIVVETRKERGDRPQSRPRGSGPMNGDSRGGFRGGRGGGGRGRGGPPAGK
ncbi:hypothetical protein EV401DRAFT_2054595 [Pisolithus croceorrhizus]|nr:hypothetical protein EV401DRAFT_2054595 [Pisolithus croceorrhizus]